MEPLILLAIFFVCVLAGVITSMLGIGEGVLLVPFLTLAVGIPIQVAIATSLVSTIANSSAASMRYLNDNRLNLRLALWFAAAATVGAIIGAEIAAQTNRSLLTEIFAAALIATALVMFLRRKESDALQGKGLRDFGGALFTLDGSYSSAPAERAVNYRARNLFLAPLSGFVAGNASGLLGIGGGIINVPVMTLGMRVPIKVATGTSALIIGLTTAVGATIYFANGFMQPLLTAIVLEAVFVGALIGPRMQARIQNEALTIIFAIVLVILALLMLVRF